jgi:diadenosine tetraphosphate (Ap4A) HIT family hydrolase
MFELDKRLENDTITIGDFQLSRVLLSKDSRYPWCILVPRVNAITESYQLSEQQQIQLCQESAWVASQLMVMFKGDSMNVAALGNVVSQLHVHHVVRFENDACWPGPIWGVGQSTPYTQSDLKSVALKITVLLEGKLGFMPVFSGDDVCD